MSVASYNQSVSFNNIHEVPITPQDETRNIDFKDINFGYGTSLINDISNYYSNYTTDRKRKLLVQGIPTKLILKNKLSPQQLQYNIENSKCLGKNYHENLDDIIQNYASDQAADVPDSTFGNKLKNANGTNLAAKKLRRKSYSEMTDEELMALDPQFQTTKLKIDQFKFDSKKTFYLPERKLVFVPKNELKLRPSLNYKSVNLTHKHENFKLNRTLLTIINGKSHSWNSLFWLLESDFLNDGDYLIISSLLPTSLSEHSNLLLEKCHNIIDSFVSHLKPNLRLKITVDLVINEPVQLITTKRDKDALNYKTFINNLYHQYTPNLVIFGNKTANVNFKYPIKLKDANNKFLVKLSSYLLKYSTIPVIEVNTLLKTKSSLRKPSVVSLNSISSNSSISSSDDSFDEIAYNDPSKFSKMIGAVSDKSLNEAREYLNLVQQEETNANVPQFKVSFNNDVQFEKVSSIYNSQLSKLNSGNSEMYKVRSLLNNSSDSLSETKLAKSDQGVSLKKIKSGLKKEEPKPEKKKKSVWKKIFK